ncbi:5-formyltetrahydrofolate cyclo-ligase [Chitinophagaceae bacterium LWZ2-11]
MTKQELRKIFKEKRTAISPHERLKLDDLMLLQFQQFNFSSVQTLLTYWPMANTAEPNTHLFSSYLRHMVYGLQIAYPVTDFTDNSMQPVVINEDTTYILNEYGIREPKAGTVIRPLDIDLVFVPLLVCDNEGYRVGYGKGFYDRFLANCRQDTVTIGFSYFNPIDHISDIEDFDIPLDYCITPDNIYEF